MLHHAKTLHCVLELVEWHEEFLLYPLYVCTRMSSWYSSELIKHKDNFIVTILLYLAYASAAILQFLSHLNAMYIMF
jgi:hypothetical protein